MMKWAAIIGVTVLIAGILLMMGVLKLAGGLIEIIAFLVVALAVVSAIAWALAKRKSPRNSDVARRS